VVGENGAVVSKGDGYIRFFDGFELCEIGQYVHCFILHFLWDALQSCCDFWEKRRVFFALASFKT